MTPKTTGWPPQAFVNFMSTRGKDVPTEGWRELPEWPVWADGYNACVKAANARQMGKM